MNSTTTEYGRIRWDARLLIAVIFPSESGCTLAISGEEDEVIVAATQHAVSVHGHEDSDEVRDWLRKNLKDEISV